MKSVFALYNCFVAILRVYELLIAGIMDPVCQSDAYEAFVGDSVNREKGHLFQGNRGRKAKFWG